MGNSTLNRRNFLLMGATATVGLAAAPVTAAPTLSEGEQTKGKIITRKLGKTGIELPVVSMGVMRADNPNILKAAYDLGIRHFDTAHGYQEGRNEEMIGNFLKDKPRKDVIIATKIHLDRGGINKVKFMEMFELSLKRLQTNYVDIFYLHGMDSAEQLNNPDNLAVLKAIKESGKARFVGVSTHTNMAGVINAAVDNKFYDVVLTSYNFSLKDDKALHDAMVRAKEAGLGLIAMKTMSGGFMDKEKKKPVNYKAALKWALKDDLICTCIPGLTSYDMLKENWTVAMNIELDSKEKTDLELAMNETGLFCKGCQTCLGQCPNNLPIPDIMRSYMYNYGYSYPAKAYTTLAELNVSDNPCGLCPTCTVTCPNGFNVREKITDIARITAVPGDFLV